MYLKLWGPPEAQGDTQGVWGEWLWLCNAYNADLPCKVTPLPVSQPGLEWPFLGRLLHALFL